MGEDDRFAFGFHTQQERTMFQRGGLWLYNKQSLLVLEEADDITHPTRKPLCRWVSVQLDGKVVQVDVRYEKLPLTCFLCGIMDHIKEQCGKFQGKNDDDRAKLYRRWFQDDVWAKIIGSQKEKGLAWTWKMGGL
ncbi:hypothetical protein ACFX13_041367 [Malus domestica]